MIGAAGQPVLALKYTDASFDVRMETTPTPEQALRFMLVAGVRRMVGFKVVAAAA
jgi:hypothetical protein